MKAGLVTAGPRPAVLSRARTLFRTTFEQRPDFISSAPGRVNLIGEHLDYNGGPVLPLAIGRRTVVAVGAHKKFQFVSEGFRVNSVKKPSAPLRGRWSDYLVGLLRVLDKWDALPDGARVAIASDVPAGAGLASSAALLVSAADALARLAGRQLKPVELAEIAYSAEHDEVGVHCGRMDQTIAAFGRARSALWFEPATRRRRLVPFPLRLWLLDTGVRHALTAGHLNARRVECETALLQLRRRWPRLRNLAQVSKRRLPEAEEMLPKWLAPCVRHVVLETARVERAAKVLARGDKQALGKILYEGHKSLRDEYQSSCPEADLLVASAERHGALGARLTGAGWGGVVLLLCNGTDGRDIVRQVQRDFRKRFGRPPTAWVTGASGGVREERTR